jgi:hypothetical protein
LEKTISGKQYLMNPPKDGKGLSYYRFTRRQREQIVFDTEDVGKTAYVCAHYERGTEVVESNGAADCPRMGYRRLGSKNREIPDCVAGGRDRPS